MKFVSNSAKETEDIARNFCSHIKPGQAILLEGHLGAGKSVFARAMIRELTSEPCLEVPSPTFTLVQIYDCAPKFNNMQISHYDLYRIENSLELIELGIDEALSEGIVIIEWPERLGEMIPPDYFRINISIDDGDLYKRFIEIS